MEKAHGFGIEQNQRPLRDELHKCPDGEVLPSLKTEGRKDYPPQGHRMD